MDIAAAIILLFAYYAQGVVITLVLSILLAYCLDPVVEFLERWRLPRTIGAMIMVLLLCAVIAVVGIALRSVGAGYALPWSRSWQYALWALLQEFILQSVFFLRLESVVGSRRAVWASSLLYALAHIPSPLLTILSFSGGLLFCECFRRWRNLYPLGIIHAALGLTIAASLPDKWLHHMRVGIGYLTLSS